MPVKWNFPWENLVSLHKPAFFLVPVRFPQCMKALIATLLLIGFCSVAYAQRRDQFAERPGDSEPFAAQVEQLTHTMSQQLRLNEAQIIQMRAANKIKISRAEEIQWQYQHNAEERNARLAELEAQYETECSRILTPSQLSMYHDDKKHDSIAVPVNATDGGLG
jgi:hypothetical protein